jgi:hypothetical protein
MTALNEILKPAIGLAAAIMLAGGLTTSALAAEDNAEDTFTENEVVDAAADFFDITSEAAAEVVSRVFQDLGEPNGYITGSEGSGAIGVGLRYGEGNLVTAAGQERRVFWQGPSIGFDAGGNASQVFTLVYDIQDADDIYRRFPGVEGSYYFVAGIGVNYQKAEDITLVPMRTGVGLRAGANIGYLSYSRRRSWLPF